MPAGDADRIRNYATRLVEDARREGNARITLRSGDIHDALGLTLAHANVCQVLDGRKFHAQACVRLIEYSGAPSRASSNSYFEFEILPLSQNASEERFSKGWRGRVLELSPSEFQELVREYLKAKGFDGTEIEITIRMKM